jgi:hypothetical protein
VAALHGATLGKEDDLDWRGSLIAFELNEQATTIEGFDVRLEQDQIGLMLQNRADIGAFRRRNIVSSARELSDEFCAQVLGDAKQ